MECPRKEGCGDATKSYRKMCDALNEAGAHQDLALNMMGDVMPNMVLEVTEGRKPNAIDLELRQLAFDGAAMFVSMRSEKTAFEEELVSILPLLEARACPTCPLKALGWVLAENNPQ